MKYTDAEIERIEAYVKKLEKVYLQASHTVSLWLKSHSMVTNQIMTDLKESVEVVEKFTEEEKKEKP